MIEKIILTGAPGSGKSSVSRALEFYYGERIIAEAAEDMIKTLKKEGHEKPWELPDFQDRILKLQLQRERQVEQYNGRVFIDRGILDQLTYYQLQGRPYSEALKKAIQEQSRYSRVFLIERGEKCENNGVRRETPEQADEHQRLHLQNYTNAGYRVERIPYLKDPQERADLIMEKVREREFAKQLLENEGGRK